MVHRGGLDIPIIGMARAGWTLDKLKQRARDSIEHGRRLRSRVFREACGAAALCGRRLHGSGDLREVEGDTGSRRPADSLSGHSAQHVRQRGARSGKVRLRGQRPCHRREALRPRSRHRASARPHAARSVRGGVHLPDRSLPGQGSGAESPVLPLRQHFSRADLESPLRPGRADHHGREIRRRRPRRLSTKKSAPFATWCRTTCCR